MMGNRKQEIIHNVTATLFAGAGMFALFLAFMTSGFECWLSSCLAVYCLVKPMLDTEPVDPKYIRNWEREREAVDRAARKDKSL